MLFVVNFVKMLLPHQTLVLMNKILSINKVFTYYLKGDAKALLKLKKKFAKSCSFIHFSAILGTFLAHLS